MQSKLTVQALSLGSGAVHIRWPEDTVFARISLLAGWPSVPEVREDTVFARINLLAGWREGTLCTAPCVGSLSRSLLILLT
ncbi:hypothetical protein [Desulfosporosinus sp. BG]|uniref:hypothetical protein n=1 Tax=Desulfosporosinus sp. BG TaxID=1633135 RepID=UPI00114CE8F9|nr:hypothetical protein [Desulfosporosinus sp. BG]